MVTVSEVDRTSVSPAIRGHLGLQPNIDEKGLLNIKIGRTFSLSPVSQFDEWHKRITHNVLEQKRRKHLQSLFNKLKHVIPDISAYERLPKINILTKAKVYIDQMVKEESRLRAELEKEKQCNAELLDKFLALSYSRGKSEFKT